MEWVVAIGWVIESLRSSQRQPEMRLRCDAKSTVGDHGFDVA